MKNKRFRIRGRHKETGKIQYMTYAIHNGMVFPSFNKEPSKFKTIDKDYFIQLQMIAQCNMNSVMWEMEDAKTYSRYQTGAAANRISNLKSSSWQSRAR